MREKNQYLGEEEGSVDVALVVEEEWNTKPLRAEEEEDRKTEIWPIVKPFLDAGSAAIAWRPPLLLILAALVKARDSVLKPPLPQSNILFSTIPSAFIVVAVQNAMLLGPFEFFSRQIEAKNKGTPPSLYQEVGCVVASSATGAVFTTPFRIAYSHIEKAKSIRPNVVRQLYAKAADKGILALWKGGSPWASRLFVGNVAMLGSYYPSSIYFRESVGLSEHRSVFGASIVSGLLTATCTYPFVYVEEAMEKMRLGFDGKKPYTRNYAECALEILKTNSNPLRIFRGSSKVSGIVTKDSRISRVALERKKREIATDSFSLSVYRIVVKDLRLSRVHYEGEKGNRQCFDFTKI